MTRRRTAEIVARAFAAVLAPPPESGSIMAGLDAIHVAFLRRCETPGTWEFAEAEMLRRMAVLAETPGTIENAIFSDGGAAFGLERITIGDLGAVVGAAPASDHD